MKFLEKHLSRMGRFERHFVMMKILSLAAALVLLLFLRALFQLDISLDLRGVLMIFVAWILIYITLTAGIALHDLYNKK